MSFTKYKTIKRTKKTHECWNCEKILGIGQTCTYGVTTDSDIVGNGKKKIAYGYFCLECRDIELNKN